MSVPGTTCAVCGAAVTGELCPACAWQEMFASLPTEPAFESAGLAGNGLVRMEEIGRGGMGVIYRARQAEPRRTVALKMMLPHQIGSAEARERFRAETRAIASLDHPAILPVYQVGEDGGLPWFTMKLAAGGSLAENVGRYAGNWMGIARLLLTLAEAIHFAHEHGILHRDLKPANVLFDEGGRPFVSDFGLAKFLDGEAALTATRATLGTPAYLAPELLRARAGAATTAADIYGLGAILYELLTGRPPFAAGNLAALFQEITATEPTAPSRLRASVPRDLELICLKCLAKAPEARYVTARELVEDLRAWREGRPIRARAASPAERCAAWCRRNPAVATLSGILVLGALTAALLLARQNRSLALALQDSRAAQSRARTSLRASLMAQARNLGQTTRPGRRSEALALLRQAAALPAEASGPEGAETLRSEAVAALARLDVAEESRWLLPLSPEHTFYFTAFSEDLDKVVLAHDRETLVLSAANRAVLARLPVEVIGSLNNLTFNRGSGLLALLERSGDGSVWELTNGTRLARFDANEGSVLSLDFHPSGQSLAVARRGRPVESRGMNGRLLGEWPVTNAYAARFSPDGGRLAILAEDGLELWQTRPARRLWSMPIYQPVHRVEWAPNGLSLLAGSRFENSILVFAAESGSLQARHHGHSRGPAQFQFHPSGSLVASAGRDGSILLWDAATGEDRLEWNGTHEALRFSRDGRRLGYSPSLLELGTLRLESSPVFRQFSVVARTPTLPEKLLVTPDGEEVITISPAGLRRWDVASGTPGEWIALPGRGLTWAGLSADGRELFYGQRNSGSWRRSRTALGAPAEALPIPVAGSVLSVNQRGDWLVAPGEGMMEIWPGGEASRARPLSRNLGGLEHSLSPDSRWLALAHRRAHAIRVVNTTNGQVVKELAGAVKWQAGSLPRAWFAPDSRHLLTSNRREFQLWETGTWRLVWSLPASIRAEASGACAIRADGKMAALEVEQDHFQLVDLPSGRIRQELRPPLQMLASAAVFSTDGRKLFVAGAGPAIFVWDLEAAQRELAALGLD